MIKRRRTKTIKVGTVKVGFGFPVSIQSMTKTDTADVSSTVKQIKSLEKAGCEIVRVAVKDLNSARLLNKIRAKIDIPLVADIHFNYRLALEAIARGVDGLRLNPGNIFRAEEVKAVAKACKKRRIPIRVGVNSGSLRVNPPTRQVANPPTKQADLMVQSALRFIKMLESFDFYDIIVSLKAADVTTTVNAYRKMASLCDYPFHLGITACGLPEEGIIKSAVGIGALLLEGLGDTIRVSLTASPEVEVKVAKDILQTLGLRNFAPEIVACPTCGRCNVDLEKIVKTFRYKLDTLNIKHETLNRRPFKIAIMGCEVNGPGEARDADTGVACGKNSAVLFKHGKVIKKIKENQIVDTLIREISLFNLWYGNSKGIK